MNSPYDFFDMTRLMWDADRAPSILNTKPWKFERVTDNRIELRPDWTRHLRVIDPRHRELVISCGAALFNLRMAIRVTGHDPVVWLLPGQQPGEARECEHCGKCCGVGDMLASVEIITHRANPVTVAEQRLYEAIPQRHTIRDPFTCPIPMNVLAELEQAARKEGARARLLHRADARRLLRSAALTEQLLKSDKAYLEELSGWTGSSARDGLGVPADQFGPEAASPRHPPVRDLGIAWGPRKHARFEKNAQLIALETETDKPSDWLRAGQALQRILLTATYYGVQASFLTQQLEEEDRRIPPFDAARPWWRWPELAQMVIRTGKAPPMGEKDIRQLGHRSQ
jgi:hypothetical protein